MSREQRVDDDHRDRREQDRQRRLQDQDEAVAEEEPHGLQVDGRARHELAGLLAVEEPELQRLQVLVERLAQVDSTPSETRPATSRRATLRTQRAIAAPAIARPSVRSSLPSERWIASTAAPVSAGIATVPTVAAPASTSDQMTPLRKGRRNPSSRQNVRTPGV